MRPGWDPGRLRAAREDHGLTLEAAGEQLRQVALRAGLHAPAANFQTLWQHEQGDVYPGPHYRRAYCLLYDLSESELKFRAPLPGERRDRREVMPVDPSTKALQDALRPLTMVRSPRLRERLVDACVRREQPELRDPVLLLVAGYAGSGKTEYARFLSFLTGWPLLDKDPLTRPLVEGMLSAAGEDPDDSQGSFYHSRVRPLEYQCLMETVHANVDSGSSMIVTAPFLAEVTDEFWSARLLNRCNARGMGVVTVWMHCDLDSMHEYILSRSAARDAWKLRHWEEYCRGVDLEQRPIDPYIVVDNSHGVAVSSADRARYTLTGARWR